MFNIESRNHGTEPASRIYQPIELLNVRVENDSDNYLWVKSKAKALKENSMNDLFCQRFEEGLRGIQNGIASKGGTKKTEKVWERIGRLKEKYSSTHQYYDIKVFDNGKGTATSLYFEKKEGVTIDDKAGIYFLRTSLNGKDEKILWMIYNLIREIEYLPGTKNRSGSSPNLSQDR